MGKYSLYKYIVFKMRLFKLKASSVLYEAK